MNLVFSVNKGQGIDGERDGVVKKIAVKEGQAVDGGDVLFEIG